MHERFNIYHSAEENKNERLGDPVGHVHKKGFGRLNFLMNENKQSGNKSREISASLKKRCDSKRNKRHSNKKCDIRTRFFFSFFSLQEIMEHNEANQSGTNTNDNFLKKKDERRIIRKRRKTFAKGSKRTFGQKIMKKRKSNQSASHVSERAF